MSDRYARYTRLHFDRPHPRVLRITMGDRPERLNAVDAVMHRELGEIWRDIDADPEVNSVIITGAGRAFSAGGDFAMVEQMMRRLRERARVWKEARDLVYNIINCGKPVVSAMRGPAVGAGLVCGLLADVSIATKDARIIDGHTRLGVAAGDHSVIVWPLLCGLAKAKYYLLLCEAVYGAEAERIGLVSLAVEDAELDAKALEIAVRLAEGAQSAIRWTKYALNNWLRMAGPSSMHRWRWNSWASPGRRPEEGLASHKEKRDHRFRRDQQCSAGIGIASHALTRHQCAVLSRPPITTTERSARRRQRSRRHGNLADGAARQHQRDHHANQRQDARRNKGAAEAAARRYEISGDDRRKQPKDVAAQDEKRERPSRIGG